ncbi:MAG: S8 family serine peptidase, partial [Cyanobacteriota bacterium]
GISVAAENGMGIVGVAPEAELVSLRLIGSTDPVNYDKDITGKTIAAALFNLFRNQESDILTNSWGPMNMIQQSLALAALEQGVNQGRNGLGNIYVFAAGNDGALDGNVNYNYFANSRYTIAVGAATRNDVQSPYSTPGAALLISAYSDNGSGESAESIMTTALDDWYADDFGGTSAAAPLVSGAVALMLEVNPNLTWRDVQHILVQTARRDGITDPAANWSGKEGDAIRHSDKYGFGIIDAAAAVNLARNWTPVAAEVPVIREFELDSVNQVIPTLDNLSVGDRLTAADSTIIQQNIKVESVEVGLSLTHPDWRDLTVVLTSPTGTQSILAKAIPPEKRTSDDGIKQGETRKHWTFNSVRHWGESSQGEWTLQVFDQQGNEVEGTWHDWKLNIHGTSNEPQPNVTIRTTDAKATEEGDTAQFVVTRDGDLNAPLTVNYVIAGTALNGTDYKELIGTVTIEAGKASGTIGAVPILDYLTEENETVTLTLRDTNTYN